MPGSIATGWRVEVPAEPYIHQGTVNCEGTSSTAGTACRFKGSALTDPELVAISRGFCVRVG
jgi:hypothetical protein